MSSLYPLLFISLLFHLLSYITPVCLFVVFLFLCFFRHLFIQSYFFHSFFIAILYFSPSNTLPPASLPPHSFSLLTNLFLLIIPSCAYPPISTSTPISHFSSYSLLFPSPLPLPSPLPCPSTRNLGGPLRVPRDAPAPSRSYKEVPRTRRYKDDSR